MSIIKRPRLLVLLTTVSVVACNSTGEACKTIGIPAFDITLQDARTKGPINDGARVIVTSDAAPGRVDTLTMSPTASASIPIAVGGGPGTYLLRFERQGYTSTTISRTVNSTGGDCPSADTQVITVLLSPTT